MGARPSEDREDDERHAPRSLEHLECGQQPHAQDRGAEKRLQLAGRSASGCGQESPSPGGARSQGHNTGLRGMVPCTGFPLNCRTPPLLGAKEYSPRVSSALWVSPSCGTPPLLGASGHGQGHSSTQTPSKQEVWKGGGGANGTGRGTVGAAVRRHGGNGRQGRRGTEEGAARQGGARTVTAGSRIGVARIGA